MMNTHLNASSTGLHNIKLEAMKDSTRRELTNTVMTEWPSDRSSCPSCLLPYRNFREEVRTQDGVLLKGNKIIIPTLLQPDILQQLHLSHQGVENPRLRARTIVFWVGINKNFEDMVARFPIYQKYQLSNPPETVFQYETPFYPWQYFSTYLFTMGRKRIPFSGGPI